METDKNKHETPKQQTERQPGNTGATAQNILEQGTEAYVQAERAVSDVYDKTASKLNETYKKIKSYSTENPGKTILITFGIGVGLVFLLRASYFHSHTGRFNRPMVKAFSALLGSFSVKALWYLKKQYKKLGKVNILKERRNVMLNTEEGKIGWILLWLLGIPIPVLVLLFIIRGCT